MKTWSNAKLFIMMNIFMVACAKRSTDLPASTPVLSKKPDSIKVTNSENHRMISSPISGNFQRLANYCKKELAKEAASSGDIEEVYVSIEKNHLTLERVTDWGFCVTTLEAEIVAQDSFKQTFSIKSLSQRWECGDGVEVYVSGLDEVDSEEILDLSYQRESFNVFRIKGFSFEGCSLEDSSVTFKKY